ncbi:hypothetical protein J6590_024245 [Homalodisca vitripennis]|nr:hypothetical protein J6590_024245 [Homalodisca vitripennis]
MFEATRRQTQLMENIRYLGLWSALPTFPRLTRTARHPLWKGPVISIATRSKGAPMFYICGWIRQNGDIGILKYYRFFNQFLSSIARNSQ